MAAQTKSSVGEAVLISALRLAARQKAAEKAQNEGFSSYDWTPQPHQAEPPPGWWLWLFEAGRGAGKTDTGADYVLRFLRKYGAAARVLVVGPTRPDVRDICAEGPSGLIARSPTEFGQSWNRSLFEARHILGGYVKFKGAEEPDALRGGNWNLLWFDELALLSEEAWDQAQFGLRLPLPDGSHPRIVATTTPKPRLWYTKLKGKSGVEVSHATTYDNRFLDEQALGRFEELYGGTRLGRQELLAEIIDEVEGALWKFQHIEENRVTRIPDGVSLVRVTVAIDPAATNNANSAATGVNVAAKGSDQHYYVIRSMSLRASPTGWANRAIDLFDEYSADRLIGEVNNGGDMVGTTINLTAKTRPDPHPPLPYKAVTATRGKAIRAEPIVGLYEQGFVHHVGVHPGLEYQQTHYPVEFDLLDEMDANVWNLTELSGRGNTKLQAA